MCIDKYILVLGYAVMLVFEFQVVMMENMDYKWGGGCFMQRISDVKDVKGGVNVIFN